mmetsp:Transcript_26073/g.26505  ORF Transcript_26073/g.26505 Transcript_26073/m.26505 type:complete len:136 (+) Transcript_26073:746-1153(+)
MGLASVVLTTLVGPRPEGFIAQHDGVRWDNSIDNLRWIPSNENHLMENLDPGVAKESRYTKKILPIDANPRWKTIVGSTIPNDPIIVNEPELMLIIQRIKIPKKFCLQVENLLLEDIKRKHRQKKHSFFPNILSK